MRDRTVWLCLILFAACGGRSDAQVREEMGALPPQTAADKVDRLLRDEAGTGDGDHARADDEVFLRRISLDLLGRLPSPEEVAAFALDTRSDKRQQWVDRWLRHDDYGTNWGRYWRDVIMYRRTEDRALLAAASLEDYLTEAFRKNTPWDQTVSRLITATGDVQENGATGLIMAQAGQPEEIVSEISRIFLGIQIQCAQCHDHPTDRWKRDEFHQLAAFFPRVAVRQDRSNGEFRFLVTVNDRPFSPRMRNANNRFAGTPEHYMPDLDDPAAPGTLMAPRFFLTGAELRTGTRDGDRRAKLAAWVTETTNPWFAKAFANRLWAELVGEGFYQPVDDLGPDRECSAPKTLEFLSQQFAKSGYDVRWLFRTILATEVYQQVSLSRRAPNEQPFQANCPQRLRGDQLFDAILHALDLAEPSNFAGRNQPPIRRRLGSPRNQFNQTFGYDPSERRDEISGTIPQALLLMNSPMVHQAMTGSRQNGLTRLLREVSDDEQLVVELYLRALGREPSTSEITTCMDYVRQVGVRQEAFEDLLWSLMNSTEFLHRR